jgi:Fic family protein
MNLHQLKTSVNNKFNILKTTNLNPELVKNLGNWLRMELTYTSNAIEGNTLTRQETKLILDEGISVGGKSVTKILEVKNHKRALEKVIELAECKKTNQISSGDLFEIHEIIFEGIDNINSGKYRNVSFRISGSMTILPTYLKVPNLMEQLFEKISSYREAGSIENIIDFAIQVHYDLVTIHPFVDGNGRAARLIFNLILLQNKLPLSFIKKEERKEYLNSLEKAQIGGTEEGYKILMYKSIERSLNLYLNQGENEKQQTKLYKIGQVAKLSNEQIPTIRHWISLGLITPFITTKSGYVLFNDEVFSLIKQIRFLQKEKRLTLDEIRQILN